MPTSLTVLHETHTPTLRDRMEDRARQLRLEGKDDFGVKVGVAELVLQHRLHIGDVTLPAHQRDLALDQHECRTFRGSAQACKILVTEGATCHGNCPVNRIRQDRRDASVRKNEEFVTDWYMPESAAASRQAAQAAAAHENRAA
jgi:hypothetical protein